LQRERAHALKVLRKLVDFLQEPESKLLTDKILPNTVPENVKKVAEEIDAIFVATDSNSRTMAKCLMQTGASLSKVNTSAEVLELSANYRAGIVGKNGDEKNTPMSVLISYGKILQKELEASFSPRQFPGLVQEIADVLTPG